MFFNVGDFVTRNSYHNDVLFKIIKIEDGTAYLKGVELRLVADSPVNDLMKVENLEKDSDDFDELENKCADEIRNQDYFYLPGKILHLDGDGEYLDRCMKFYKKHKIYAIGKRIDEDKVSDQIIDLLKKYRPDIVVITGHDSYLKHAKNNMKKDIINNYKNSKHFVSSVINARKYEKSHDKLVIIAGACQSDYEELIKAGANFASSPKRINIHALDPAIIAVSLATTEKNQEIDLINLLSKTKYGKDGMGGIRTTGLMYVGFPR